MKKEIWVAGYPSFLGGADTELLANVDLWRMNDVEVNLVPMFGEDARIRKYCDSIGCKTLPFRPDIFKDKIVASWCNGEFLKYLPRIMAEGKPAKVIWFNCMTWEFADEIAAHKNGWITQHGFVSNFQKSLLKPKLEAVAPVMELEGYRPYFNPQNPAQDIKFQYREHRDWFALGRISRDDANKFHEDMWNMFYKVCTPRHKKVFILGFGANAHSRTGAAPTSRAFRGCQGLDWQIWGPNEIPVKQIYNILHCIMHKTGGSRESYCRIVPEAYAYGVPIIVEDAYAFPDLVDNGVTGYRCKSSDEMSFRASELAFDEEKRRKMIFAARDFLLNEIASPSRCWAAWERVFKD